MQKTINKLDFLKGQKTKIGAVALVASLIVSAFTDIAIGQKMIEEGILLVVSESSTIASSILVVYGLVMKLVRKFTSK
jgi:hypothetical protein